MTSRITSHIQKCRLQLRHHRCHRRLHHLRFGWFKLLKVSTFSSPGPTSSQDWITTASRTKHEPATTSPVQSLKWELPLCERNSRSSISAGGKNLGTRSCLRPSGAGWPWRSTGTCSSCWLTSWIWKMMRNREERRGEQLMVKRKTETGSEVWRGTMRRWGGLWKNWWQRTPNSTLHWFTLEVHGCRFYVDDDDDGGGGGGVENGVDIW